MCYDYNIIVLIYDQASYICNYFDKLE